MSDTPPLLIDVLGGSGAPEPAACLAERVRFRSPYADYAGRADVAHLAVLIRQVLADLRVVRRLADGPDTMTQFEAGAAGEPVQGVLVEHRDPAGLVVDAMLTIRPYSGLRASMRAMQVLLESAPLPSRRPS